MSDDRKKPREVETVADEVSGQPSQRRRRLVKGALSAPVFLTLQNGSVFANTSNDASVVADNGHNINDAVVYEVGDTVNIECVIADNASEHGETNVDFGEHYACLPEKIADGNLLDFEGLDPEDQKDLKIAGLNNCRKNGGYIVAGSSHASLCH